jgi:hypothetical protein
MNQNPGRLARFLEPSSFSAGQSDGARPLMTPDEIMTMSQDDQLIFVQGLRGIRATKLRFYSWTPALTSRDFGFRDSLIPSLIWRRDDGATVAVRFVGAFGADQQGR